MKLLSVNLHRNGQDESHCSGQFIFIVHIPQSSRASFRCISVLGGSSHGSIANLHCEVVALGLRELGGEERDN